MTTAQRQRIRFWTWECGYAVIEGPSEPDSNGIVEVTIKHPKGNPLRYLLAADGASVRAGTTRPRATSNQDMRPSDE